MKSGQSTASPRWRPNHENAQHPERSDANSMRSPNVERSKFISNTGGLFMASGDLFSFTK